MTHEEAIKILREAHDNALFSVRTALETLIPELAESEDERVIKALETFINQPEIADKITFEARIGWLTWLEKQKENPKSADSIPSDCASDVKCEDRWHKTANSLPNNGRDVLAKDALGNYLIASFDGAQWFVSVYDGEDHPVLHTPPIIEWCDIPSETCKESLHVPESCKENANSFTDSIIEVRSFQRGIEEGRRQEQEKHKEPHYTKRNALFDKCVENCDPEVMKEVSDEIDEMLKKEQKLADSEEKFESIDNAFRRGREVGFHEGVESVKLAEWSEEDEEISKRIISDLRWGRRNSVSDKDIRQYDEEINWIGNKLKSLRPQSREKIYQSAKHDLAIRFMNYLDENRPDGKMGLSNGECEDIDKAFKENDWAKIMRYVEKYRPHWKPSEEQMRYLLAVINNPNNAGAESCHLTLESIYNELKKLK